MNESVSPRGAAAASALDDDWRWPLPRRAAWWVHGPLLLALGTAAGLLAVMLAHAPTKGLVAGVAACLILPALLWLRGDRMVTTVVVALLGLSVPINLRVNFFVEPHVGGAPSITVTLTVLLVLLLWFVWLHRRLTGHIDRLVQVHRPIALALLALLLMVLPSYGNALYPKLVVLEWIRLALLGVGLMAMMNLRDERLLRVFCLALSVQCVFQTAVAVAQYGFQRELGLGLLGEEAPVFQNIGIVGAYRATGTLGHPNILSYFYEMLLPLLLALALTRQRMGLRLWYAFCFVCGLAGLFVTLTRGAWITLPLSSLLVLVMVYGRRIVRVQAAITACVVALALFAASLYAWPIIEKRFTHSDYKSSASRMPLNLAALSVVEKYPLAGVGLNNFAERFKVEDTTGHSRIFVNYQQLVHNMYLWIATEAGLIGLVGFMGLFVTSILVALRVAPRAPPVPRAMLVGVAAGLLAHLMHGFFDPGFRVSLPNSYQIFLAMGMVGMLAMQYGHKRSAWFARRSA